MRAPVYERLDEWLEIHKFRNGPPPKSADDLYAWIHLIHVPSPFEPLIAQGFRKVMRQHVGGNQEWLAISGPAHLGKTAAVTNILMEWAAADPHTWRTRIDGITSTPYVYVQAASNQEAKGLLATIARSCHLPDKGTEQELKAMLARTLPALGTRLIVVDDAHMYRRKTDRASKVTDSLRKVLEIPVPFAFVGIDLHSSALLYTSTQSNDTALQLEFRSDAIALPLLDQRHDAQTVLHLLRQFIKRASQIDGLDLSGFSDGDALARVVTAGQGRPGTFLNALKRVVVEAIAEHDGVVTPALFVIEGSRATLGPGLNGL